MNNKTHYLTVNDKIDKCIYTYLLSLQDVVRENCCVMRSGAGRSGLSVMDTETAGMEKTRTQITAFQVWRYLTLVQRKSFGVKGCSRKNGVILDDVTIHNVMYWWPLDDFAKNDVISDYSTTLSFCRKRCMSFRPKTDVIYSLST